MSRKEEKLLAVQNIGAVAFLIGLLLSGSARNGFTFTFGCITLMVGIIVIWLCDIKLDKLDDKDDVLLQKNKGC